MQSYNFINFIHVVDISLLNFIDYYELENGTLPINENGQIYLALTTTNKKILTSFIIDNINSLLHYGKINVVINTCKPMKNWRQYSRNAAVRNYKYKILDDSVYIDELKFNSFIDHIFNHLPKINIKKINILRDQIGKYPISINSNIHYLEFQNIDITDIKNLTNMLLANIGSITFDLTNYNIIDDGNMIYEHNSSYSNEIIDEFRLTLAQNGLI